MSRPTVSPTSAQDAHRQFALEVVKRLREAGFQALWAGGCVRDQLLGRTPKDYDVATNARPDQVRQLFGKPRTLAIGAAFGVVAVLGTRGVKPIEVATFRRDAEYSDGRHPDGVVYSDAAEDAQRRDFTINGIFYDPIDERVVDYVRGQLDLKARIVRAIGDPKLRFGEDKLRMVRAVRFAATFDFAIDPATFEAIRELAGEVVIVSAERIAAELRSMLAHERRRRAVELLCETGLLRVLLPESAPVADATPQDDSIAGEARRRLLNALEALELPSFPVALAILLRGLTWAGVDAAPIRIAQRWRLSNPESATTARLLEFEATIRAAADVPWPRVQRVLAAEGVEELLAYVAAIGQTLDGHVRGVDFCRAKLRLPPEVWNPPPLLTGDDLRAAGHLPGPRFRRALDAVRDAQLDGFVTTRDAALELARSHFE